MDITRMFESRDSQFKPVLDTEDERTMKESLLDS